MKFEEYLTKYTREKHDLHNKISRIKGGRTGKVTYPTHVIVAAIKLYDRSTLNEKHFAQSIGLHPRTFCGWLLKRRQYLKTPSFPEFGEFSPPSEGFFKKQQMLDRELHAISIGEYLEQGA